MAIEQERAAATPGKQILATIGVPRELLIGGTWRPAADGERLPVTDPSTGRQVSDVAAAGEADIDAAVAAGRLAFEEGSWSRMVPAARARALNTFADAVEARIDYLYQVETLCNGRPIAEFISNTECTQSRPRAARRDHHEARPLTAQLRRHHHGRPKTGLVRCRRCGRREPSDHYDVHCARELVRGGCVDRARGDRSPVQPTRLAHGRLVRRGVRTTSGGVAAQESARLRMAGNVGILPQKKGS